MSKVSKSTQGVNGEWQQEDAFLGKVVEVELREGVPLGCQLVPHGLHVHLGQCCCFCSRWDGGMGGT